MFGRTNKITSLNLCPPEKLVVSQNVLIGARSKFWGLSGSEDRGGGDNSFQFINFGRVGDKSFKEWRKKIGEGGGSKSG